MLQKESELQEIVQLVGVDALPEREKGVLDVARMIREDYLQQSAYDEVDTYTSIQKQYRMLRAILSFGDREQEAIVRGAQVGRLQAAAGTDEAFAHEVDPWRRSSRTSSMRSSSRWPPP